MQRRPVNSSNIASVGFDPDRNVLEIEFKSGGIYQYLDVPQIVFNNLERASSVGRYFSEHIRDQYRTIKIN